MALFDSMRDRWERWTPRERRLVGLLGLTGVVCILSWGGFMVRDGLRAIETRNQESRDALRLIEENRDEILAEKNKQGRAIAVIGNEAPPLATYLETIANEIGIQIPESTIRPPVAKGKFQELSVDVKLRNVTIHELADFLRRVETKSHAVVTQRLYVVKSRFGQQDKLDSVELTIATYEKVKSGKSDAKGDKPDAGDARPGTDGKGG